MNKTTFDQVKDILIQHNMYYVIIQGEGVIKLKYFGLKDSNFVFFDEHQNFYHVTASSIVFIEDDAIQNMPSDLREFFLNIIKKKERIKKIKNIL